MRAPLLDGNNRDERDREDKVRNDRQFNPERENRERGSGARDRDTARTINGVEDRPQCQSELRCMEDFCRQPNSKKLQWDASFSFEYRGLQVNCSLANAK